MHFFKLNSLKLKNKNTPPKQIFLSVEYYKVLHWKRKWENSMDRGAWQARVHGVTRVGHHLMTQPPMY